MGFDYCMADIRYHDLLRPANRVSAAMDGRQTIIYYNFQTVRDAAEAGAVYQLAAVTGNSQDAAFDRTIAPQDEVRHFTSGKSMLTTLQIFHVQVAQQLLTKQCCVL